MGQIKYKCEFGVVHKTANCRCIDSHVTVRQIKCDVPEEHHIPLTEAKEIEVHEYMTVHLSLTGGNDKLNQFGLAGWRVVGFSTSDAFGWYVLERKRQEPWQS